MEIVPLLENTQTWPEWETLSDETIAGMMASLQSVHAIPELILEDLTHRLYQASKALQNAVQAADFLTLVPIPEDMVG